VGEPRGEETVVLVRLNKLLADHGIASRRGADELIAAGKVSVDGEPATELGLRVDPQRQRVEVDGSVLRPRSAQRRYYVLNKPPGVVCTNEPRETRPRAVDLVTDPRKGRIYTVGRLDEASQGLILLTNDGAFANRIMHPRYGIQKTYLVKVRGEIDDDALRKVREGVHLAEGRTAGARILVERRGRDHSLLSVIVHEGMNREIRRTFAKVGYKVLELRRTRIGPLTDHRLKTGRWRELERKEVEALLAGESGGGDVRRRQGRKEHRPAGRRSGPLRGRGKLGSRDRRP
jgi:23S rRNA pseudouridine2605 synthase